MAHNAKQLKQMHMQRIRDYFYHQIECNKIQLSEETGISKTTCTSILKELLEQDFIFQIENNVSTGGRPSKQYKLNPDFYHECLIDIQGSSQVKIKIKVCNLYGQTQAKMEEYCTKFSMKKLHGMLDSLFEDDDRISVIAVSIPGVVREGNCIVSSDIKELEQRNLDILLGEKYQVDVVVENDVNLAVVGYHEEEDSLAFVFQPREKFSGCGIMLNHQLYRGSTLFAGEIGMLSECQGVEPATLEEAKYILRKQLIALICVLNPRTIVVASQFPLTCDMIYKELYQNLDIAHVPNIEVVDDIEVYVFRGLREAAREQKRTHIIVEEVRKV